MIQRKFILGEEWLYYKLYCGARTADHLLSTLILPVTEKLLNENHIEQWFFIRYADPKPHLRLRFKLKEISSIGSVIAAMKTETLPYIHEKRLWKIQTDTYARELERYGNTTMELSETLFFHDSILITKAMDLVEDDELYFLFMLRCIRSFVQAFSFSAEEELRFYQKNALAFKEEFKMDKSSKLPLDKKYRGLRKEIDQFLSSGASEYAPLWELLKARDTHISKEITTLLDKNKEGTLEVPIQSLMSSYIHMCVNRAFRGKQRFYELVIYDFLERHTKSSIKRKVVV
ncbi:thiopeptide-type bacteriocin biosynthesis protein [Spongiimicrobium salis]|uniref:thiopeptide-type bacteriocin biosynthesis protein n=1 Tax=Spongiimicrobium salis TaxID=1667022 RepID=UPI00374DC8D5